MVDKEKFEQTRLIKIINEVEVEARESGVPKSQMESRISRRSSVSNTIKSGNT